MCHLHTMASFCLFRDNYAPRYASRHQTNTDMISQLNLIILPDQTSTCSPPSKMHSEITPKGLQFQRSQREGSVPSSVLGCQVSGHFCLRYRRLMKTMSQNGQIQAGQSTLSWTQSTCRKDYFQLIQLWIRARRGRAGRKIILPSMEENTVIFNPQAGFDFY